MRHSAYKQTKQSPSGGLQPQKSASRTFPRSSAPWQRPASRNSPERKEPLKSMRTILDAARDDLWLCGTCDAAKTLHVALLDMNLPLPNTSDFARPYVVSWNLTYRCNLACEHCYLDAGGAPLVDTENFSDRSELNTDECFRVIDEIAGFAPECVTILTGGEPLLRRDILEIVRRAAERGLWVVVGTNGVRITENVAQRLAEAGARGLSLSLDALDPDRHDRFRKVRGAWKQHGRRRRDPQPDQASLHRADDRGLAQSRRARSDRRLRARSPRREGLEPLLPRADRTRAVRLGHHPRAVRRGSRVALPDPAKVQRPDAREREVRSALHQDRAGEFRPASRPIAVLQTANRRDGPVNPRSGPTPAELADARRGPTTWGFGQTAMSRPARISRCSQGPFARRLFRTSGPLRSCSTVSAAVALSGAAAGTAR